MSPRAGEIDLPQGTSRMDQDTVDSVLASFDWRSVPGDSDAQRRVARDLVRARLATEGASEQGEVLRALAAILELEPDGREAPECPFWPKATADAIPRDTLGHLAASS